MLTKLVVGTRIVLAPPRRRSATGFPFCFPTARPATSIASPSMSLTAARRKIFSRHWTADLRRADIHQRHRAAGSGNSQTLHRNALPLGRLHPFRHGLLRADPTCLQTQRHSTFARRPFAVCRPAISCGWKKGSRWKRRFWKTAIWSSSAAARTSGPTHIGIALGDGRFLHARGGRGVRIDFCDAPEYAETYVGAIRLSADADLAVEAA